MTDPDAMWKPGYGRPPPAVPPADHAVHPDHAVRLDHAVHPDQPAAVALDAMMVAEPPQERSPSNHRRGPIAALALGLLAAAVGVGVLAGGSAGSGRPDVGVIAAADERLIPRSIEQKWSAVLPGSGSALATNIDVAGDDLVVVVVDDGSRDRTSVVGFDVETGAARWRRGFSFAPPEVRILGVVDERVVLEQFSPSGRRLFALATTDGSTQWDTEVVSNAFSVILEGTSVIGRVVDDGETPPVTQFLDPETGELVGVVAGWPLSTDLAGTWFVGGPDGVVSIDLSDGWSPSVSVAGAGVTADEQLLVVGDRLVVLGRLGTLTELVAGERVRLGVVDGLTDLDSAFPSGGATFVGVGPETVVGAELVGDAVRVTWRIEGTVRNYGVTERGLMLALSEAGAGFVDGDEFVVVDGVSGDRLASSGPAPAADQVPVIVGDGFIVTRATVDGRERIGHDLDGTVLWRLPATGKLRVGNGVIAALDNTPAGFAVRVYGPSESGTVDAASGATVAVTDE